jgi:D-amino peptidase
MKVLISADMEGTCGVVSWIHVNALEVAPPGEPVNTGEYERARLRMTREVNAAIAGAYDAGAEEVIVNDSHDGQRNLLPEELDPRCRYITGSDKPLGMMQGIDLAGIGAVFFTGYHARSGTPNGPLAHTWNGWIQDVRIDGVSTGEFGINAAIAGHFGVPVALVTGDRLAVEQTQAWCGNGVVGVAVKEGLSTFAAIHMAPARAQELIRAGAADAVRATGSLAPYRLPASARVEVEVDHQARADQMILVPGVERAGNRVVAYTAADGLDFIRKFRAVAKIGGIRMTP